MVGGIPSVLGDEVTNTGSPQSFSSSQISPLSKGALTLNTLSGRTSEGSGADVSLK